MGRLKALAIHALLSVFGFAMSNADDLARSPQTRDYDVPRSERILARVPMMLKHQCAADLIGLPLPALRGEGGRGARTGSSPLIPILSPRLSKISTAHICRWGLRQNRQYVGSAFYSALQPTPNSVSRSHTTLLRLMANADATDAADALLKT